MELINLKAEIRKGKGKGYARFLRKNGSVPGILYGPKTEPVMLSLSANDLTNMVRKYGSTGLFINLDLDEGNRTVMLKDFQMDTFNLNCLHVDFQEIDLDKKIVVSVPVEITGESESIKMGGVLQTIRREIDVLCRPADVPENVVIDISTLDIGDSVHIEDISMGDEIELPHDVNYTILNIAHPTAAAEEEVEEEEELEAETEETAETAETAESAAE